MKQTARLSSQEGFTCIGEIEEKIVTTSFNPKARQTTIRLLGLDLRDLYQHAIEQEGRSSLSSFLHLAPSPVQAQRHRPPHRRHER